MNRRDFFQPRSLVARAARALDALDEPLNDLAERQSPSALLRLSRRAMATIFEVLLPCGTPDGMAAAEAALGLIDALEAQLTVYRETSEVSGINRRAAKAPVPVEERLFGLLSLAEQLTRDTDGAFDVASGALTKAWGFFRREGHVPNESQRAEVLTRVGMRHVQLDPERRTIRFLHSGVELNLGSIGKGYALDRAAEVLQSRWGVENALLHGGRSSVLALGDEPGRRGGWAIGISDPTRPERRLAVVRLQNHALATSAATYQNLEHKGRKLGHILDPRTGWPAEQLLSASVIAPTAAQADALATAFFVLGADKMREYCENHAEIGAVLVPRTERPIAVGMQQQADIELV